MSSKIISFWDRPIMETPAVFNLLKYNNEDTKALLTSFWYLHC